MSRRRNAQKVLQTAASVLRAVGQVALLSVDCLFLAFDVVAVNLKKTGLFKEDCRGGIGNEGRCRPCRKYTNLWLFRLICRDVRFPSEIPLPGCAARDGVRIYFLRSVGGALLILALLCGALVVMALV